MIDKALCYITRGDELLVFRQPQFPEQGLQVPGGSLEPGESRAQAALREAREETGLAELELRDYLGSAVYELKIDVGPPHHRHFFHLAFTGQPTASWVYPGSRRAGDVVSFALCWQSLRDPALRLDWEMGAFLDALRARLGVSIMAR